MFSHKWALDSLSCNCTALRKASRRLSQLYNTALAPVGLRSTQYSLLLELSQHVESPLTVNEVAKLMVMDRSTLVRCIKPLERELLISMDSRNQRHVRLVLLTELGKTKMEEARPLWQDAQDLFEAQFGSGEAADLRLTLASASQSLVHLD